MMGLGWEYDARIDAYVVRCPVEDRVLAHIDGDLVEKARGSFPGATARETLHYLIDASRGRFTRLYLHTCPDDVPSDVSDETQEARR